VVVDASALVELLLNLDAAPAVRSALRGASLFAPSLLDGEVLSGIRSAWLRGALTDDRAEIAIDRLAVMPVERVPDHVLLHEAWSLRHNVSAADALYVALARRLECPLVTLDRRLATAPGLGITVIVPG
jgi:predicted nucleic acid-binding protein